MAEIKPLSKQDVPWISESVRIYYNELLSPTSPCVDPITMQRVSLLVPAPTLDPAPTIYKADTIPRFLKFRESTLRALIFANDLKAFWKWLDKEERRLVAAEQALIAQMEDSLEKDVYDLVGRPDPNDYSDTLLTKILWQGYRVYYRKELNHSEEKARHKFLEASRELLVLGTHRWPQHSAKSTQTDMELLQGAFQAVERTTRLDISGCPPGIAWIRGLCIQVIRWMGQLYPTTQIKQAHIATIASLISGIEVQSSQLSRELNQ